MYGLPLIKFVTLLLLISSSHAGLVHHRAAKEESLLLDIAAIAATTAPALDQDNKLSLEQIPVTIIQEPEPQRNLNAVASAASTDLPPTVSEPLQSSNVNELASTASVVQETFEPQLQEATFAGGLSVAQPSDSLATEILQPQEEATSQPLDSSAPLQLTEEQLTVSFADSEVSAQDPNSIKGLPATDIGTNEQQFSDFAAPQQESSAGDAIILKDDLHRQVTQAPPTTQTSTQQNFVQQLIQNSPIGQFLSQFTGQQQQQQQQQVQQQQQPQQTSQLADEPATPAPTLPGFLNPQVAITSAQQAVQNAAQSVVNTTTQAFQGLQQFATNLGTQFQNTFSNLAGQQSQLGTSESTTPRPPGPIQSLVNNFVNPGSNQATDGATNGPGQQQQQQQPGPLQGILSFFQGGNRPQTSSTIPPKDEPVTPIGVDDKIEEAQSDAIADAVPEKQEPDTVNEVRSSAELTNEDQSLEESQGEDLIVVNDDSVQQIQDAKA